MHLGGCAVLNGFLVLLLCQFLGELLVLATHVPVPGPVLGMVLLLLALVAKKRTPDSVRLVSEGLLRHLALLYVPAGVGLMVHLEMISEYWLAILVALLVSSFVTLLVTALVFKLLGKALSDKALVGKAGTKNTGEPE
jgi:holin-like protein